MVYLGDGVLNYMEKFKLDARMNKSHSVTVDDLDLDGNIDIVLANVASANTVFTNIEKGRVWKKITLGEKEFNTYDIMTSDLNWDRRLDIVDCHSFLSNPLIRDLSQEKRDLILILEQTLFTHQITWLKYLKTFSKKHWLDTLSWLAL